METKRTTVPSKDPTLTLSHPTMTKMRFLKETTQMGKSGCFFRLRAFIKHINLLCARSEGPESQDEGSDEEDQGEEASDYYLLVQT